MNVEWIETSGRTVEDAKEELLDQLGVDDSEVEFEVLEEPRAGLFGRVRGEARVRARLTVRTPRAKDERRRRSPKSGSEKSGSDKPVEKGGASKGGSPTTRTAAAAPGTAAAGTEDPGTERAGGGATRSGGRGPREPRSDAGTSSARGQDGRAADVERADAAPLVPVVKEFLEGVLQSFDLEGTVAVEVVEGDLRPTIDGTGLGPMIGPAGGVVEALQELTRTVVQKNSDGPAPRLRLDVGRYRAGRAEVLEAFAREVGEKVVATGKAHAFEPMIASERKIVHDALSEVDGVATSSEGEDPDRRIVASPV